jgi:glycosyltransferase involved in cell wall biosynthesis
MKKAVWITWENQRRNKSLSKALDVELFQFDVNVHRLLRYPLVITKTLWTFFRHRPHILYAQNPSIILATMAVIHGMITRKKVVIDAHNAGLFPLGGRVAWANKLTYFLFRHSYLTIVTNAPLKQHVESHGGRAAVLPDPFPEIDRTINKKKLKGRVNFLLICTWAHDEPYHEAIEAFSRLNPDLMLYVTGNSKGKEKTRKQPIPPNVVLTGFLPNSEFDQLLISCDCVIDLTTREDCLVCGAYESVAAGKPLILSDTQALRNYFSGAALYTNNDVASITECVRDASERLEEITQQVDHYYEKQQKHWQQLKQNLLDQITP